MTDLDTIGEMFARLAGCFVTSELCGDARDPMLDHGSAVIAAREEIAADPVYRGWLSRHRERARAKRMATDPEYASRRAAQLRAAQERFKARKAAKKRRKGDRK